MCMAQSCLPAGLRIYAASMMFSMGHRVVKFKRGRDRTEFVTYDRAMHSDILTVWLVLRFGRAAEALVWGMPFLLQPISAVYYPLDVLPPWLQTLAWLLPSTHVFEGMRTALHLGTVHIGSLLAACGINLVYLAGGVAVFGWMMRHTREKGYLSRFGMQ
jgi:hypothetical protein